jgi:hypothetical protein
MSTISVAPSREMDKWSASPCANCYDLDPQNLPGDNKKGKRVAVPSLRETRSSGCCFCSLICDAFDLGAVNYAKESNLRINNDNLAKERLYYYNLYAKNYYFRNALSLF